MELLKAFFLIFVAEMGDKTQILAMAFATKYKIKNVLLGIFIGSLLNHALAVLLGANLYRFIPIETLSIIAGLSFVLFGVWNLKQDDDEEEKTPSKLGPVLTVSLAFFIGELGDKTQLTAIILATDATYPILILAGTVLGMVFTGFLGIIIGIKLGSKIDEFYIKITASFVFFLFGYLKLIENFENTLITPLSLIVLTVLVIVLSTYLLVPTIKQRRAGTFTTYQKVATRLENYYSKMHDELNDICLGENHCGSCDGTSCLVGYTKNLILNATLNKKIDPEDIKSKLNKDYKRVKVLEALKETLDILLPDWNNAQFTNLHTIRNVFEMILYKDTITVSSKEEYIKKLETLDSQLVLKIK